MALVAVVVVEVSVVSKVVALVAVGVLVHIAVVVPGGVVFSSAVVCFCRSSRSCTRSRGSRIISCMFERLEKFGVLT